jgi:hypothetical protein
MIEREKKQSSETKGNVCSVFMELVVAVSQNLN